MTLSGTGPLGNASVVILWITAAIMIIGGLVYTVRALSARADTSHFYYLTALIPLVAGTLYMVMAAGYGGLYQSGHVFLFGRYIDWAITTPLLLLDLALFALPSGIPGRIAVIVGLIAADLFMIFTGLAASAIRSNFRWALFGFSCAGFLAVVYFIAAKLTPVGSNRSEFTPAGSNRSGFTPGGSRRSNEDRKAYNMLSGSLLVLWVCYPIVWALGKEGFGVLPFFVEILLFAILDVVAKVGWGGLLLAQVAKREQATGDYRASNVSPQI